MADNRPVVPAALIDAMPQDDLPEQLDLLGLPRTQIALAAGQASAARRGGRVKGVPNRATANWVAFLRARYPDPMVRLAQLAFAPIDDLARDLNASRLDVLAEQRKMLADLLPYFHTRQPIAVDVTNRRVINLTIEMGELAAADDGDPLAGVTLIEHAAEDPSASTDDISEG